MIRSNHLYIIRKIYISNITSLSETELVASINLDPVSIFDFHEEDEALRASLQFSGHQPMNCSSAQWLG